MSVVTAPRPVRAPQQDRPGPSEERRHLRVVAKPRLRHSRRLLATAALVVMFAVLLGTVAFHVRLVKGQQHIDQLNRQAQQAQDTYNGLRVEVDRLSAPERIIANARKLGMVPADNPVWLAPSSGVGKDTVGANDPSVRDYLDVKPYLQEAP